MRKLTHKEIVARQQDSRQLSRLPLTVVLNDIRSLHNVGSIFRTADGAAVEKIWLCGITGYPPAAQIHKTALGAEQHVPWEYEKNVLTVLKELKRKHYQIVFLEQTQESISHQEFCPQSPVCLVVGNEVSGISEEILSYCDASIEIEMAGMKNSLNVSVAFGIIAYHFRSCFLRKAVPPLNGRTSLISS